LGLGYEEIRSFVIRIYEEPKANIEGNMKKYEGIMKDILRNMKYEKIFELSPYIRAGPKGKLGIYPRPRNMKKYEEI